MEIRDPNFTCEKCDKTWTLWGLVDMKELNASFPHCPWCGVVLTLTRREES